MSSKRISKRLSSLSKIAEHKYDVVWDLCCDHGLLGLSILKNDSSCFVNFIDIVPSIIDKLKSTCGNHSWLSSDRYEVLLLDARDIAIDSTKNNLVIISGVGSELAIDFINEITKKHGNLNIDFIISSQYQLFDIRSFLRSSNFGLIYEEAVVDKRRVYEIIQFSKNVDLEISIRGNMWDKNNIDHKNHIESLITYYKLKRNDDTAKSYSNILEG